jgi:hypothetical protein
MARVRWGVLSTASVGRVERVPVDPEGAFALTDPDHDVYRIEAAQAVGRRRDRLTSTGTWRGGGG